VKKWFETLRTHMVVWAHLGYIDHHPSMVLWWFFGKYPGWSIL